MISALELRRQFLHLTFGVFLVILLYFRVFNVYHMIAILAAGLIMSYLCRNYEVPISSWVMAKFERENNLKIFPGRGPIYLMIGSISVLILFPLKIALASMMILALGDAFSHIFGKLLSAKTYTHLKSVEGTMAGIVFSFFGALIFVNLFPAIVGSVLSMLVENIKLDIDDNLLIPIIAASVMSLV